MKTTYTAKELMQVALQQISDKEMEKRRKREAKKRLARSRNEYWRLSGAFKRTVR